jgi:hypothetical protein
MGLVRRRPVAQPRRDAVKKVRAAAVVAAVSTAVTQVREYAREHPEQASRAVDTVEGFVRGRAAPKHGPSIDKGSRAIRKGLGLPLRPLPPAALEASSGPDLEDPDPDTDEPWHPHGPLEAPAPNPAPGTSDDPQPRRYEDDPAPMTPGEHLPG